MYFLKFFYRNICTNIKNSFLFQRFLTKILLTVLKYGSNKIIVKFVYVNN